MGDFTDLKQKSAKGGKSKCLGLFFIGASATKSWESQDFSGRGFDKGKTPHVRVNDTLGWLKWKD